MATGTYYQTLSRSSPNSDAAGADSELSSDDINNHSPNNPAKGSVAADDFVLDEESESNYDDDIPQRSPTSSRSPSPSVVSPSEDALNGSHHGSQNGIYHPHREQNSNIHGSQSDRDSEGSENDADADAEADADADDSSYRKGDDGDDDDGDHNDDVDDEGSGEDDKMSEEADEKYSHDMSSENSSSDHANGNAFQSDSDDMSEQPARRRTRRSNKLVVPEEMRDDDQYFRRSSRSRSVPKRFSSTKSDSSVGSDLDFNAEEGTLPLSIGILFYSLTNMTLCELFSNFVISFQT